MCALALTLESSKGLVWMAVALTSYAIAVAAFSVQTSTVGLGS